MENKYYTPRLEEFRIGFAYEIRHYSTMEDFKQEPMDWFDKIIVNGWDQNEFYFIKNRLKSSDDIRVKYLEMRDTAKIGFVPRMTIRQQLYGSEVGTYERHIDHLTYRINLWWNTQKCIIELHNSHTHDLNEFVQVFNGTIKNISELRQVLDMIGVEYDS